MEETERRKPPTGSSSQNPKSATKKTSQDSGNPPSDSSDTSKPNTLPRKGTNLGAKALSHKKNSPQLEAVRKMDAMKKIGHKTRKYDAKLEDEEGTATLKFDRKTKTWKLEMKSAVNAQVICVLLELFNDHSRSCKLSVIESSKFLVLSLALFTVFCSLKLTVIYLNHIPAAIHTRVEQKGIGSAEK